MKPKCNTKQGGATFITCYLNLTRSSPIPFKSGSISFQPRLLCYWPNLLLIKVPWAPCGESRCDAYSRLWPDLKPQSLPSAGCSHTGSIVLNLTSSDGFCPCWSMTWNTLCPELCSLTPQFREKPDTHLHCFLLPYFLSNSHPYLSYLYLPVCLLISLLHDSY